MCSPTISTRSRISRRKVPTSRSQIAFIRGACGGRAILVPAASKTASNEAVKLEPRSRIRNLTEAARCAEVHQGGCGLPGRPRAVGSG